MKVLVTGGGGFLGGWVSRALLARGDEVRVLGRNPERLRTVAEAGAEPVQADLRDARRVAAACKGVDAVVHAGALCAPWGRLIDFQDINVGGTSIVIAACRDQGVGRLVHLSSPSVLLNGEHQEAVREDHPYARRRLSVYAETKKLAEDVVNAAVRTGFPAVILRPKAVFGPGDGTLLPRLLAAARAGRLRQVGSGENRIDPTYVENAVHAVLLALEAPAAVGRTYTITNGETVRLWDLVRCILDGCGLRSELRPISYHAAMRGAFLLEVAANFTRREPVLTRQAVAMLGLTQTYDISAARADLGYEPVVPLQEGIRRTLEDLAARSAPTA